VRHGAPQHTHLVECVTNNLLLSETEQKENPRFRLECIVSEPTLRKPALLSLEPGSSAPKLRARRCGCGHLSFPAQRFGCERCGLPGEQSAETSLDARGVLTALTVVRVHSKLPVPYFIGRVTLDAGPAIDVVLSDDPGLAVGKRVAGKLFVDKDASGAEALDCRFTLEEQAS
jgi:uncharacterized OB-fold protein